MVSDGFLGRPDGGIGAVRFWAGGEIGRALRQRNAALGVPQSLYSIESGVGQYEGSGVGMTDVLAG